MVRYKLIAARKAKKMTQKDVANEFGVSQSQYQRREKGVIPLYESDWVRLATILGKGIEDIKEEDCIEEIKNDDNHLEKFLEEKNNIFNIIESSFNNQQVYIEMLKKEIHMHKEENRWLKEEIRRISV